MNDLGEKENDLEERTKKRRGYITIWYNTLYNQVSDTLQYSTIHYAVEWRRI